MPVLQVVAVTVIKNISASTGPVQPRGCGGCNIEAGPKCCVQIMA